MHSIIAEGDPLPPHPPGSVSYLDRSLGWRRWRVTHEPLCRFRCQGLVYVLAVPR